MQIHLNIVLASNEVTTLDAPLPLYVCRRINRLTQVNIMIVPKELQDLPAQQFELSTSAAGASTQTRLFSICGSTGSGILSGTF